MRLALSILLVLASGALAWAQTAPRPPRAPNPPTQARPPAQPKPPAQAKPDPVAASYATMTEQQRRDIQLDLIWTGDFNGIAGPDFGARPIAAVKAFQKRSGNKDTGVLNPKERATLLAEARKKREAVGWKIVDDAITGVRLGLPTKLVPQNTAVTGGTRWFGRNDILVNTSRTAGALQAAYDGQRAGADRKVTYALLRPDYFIVSGEQAGKKFYARSQAGAGEVRGFTITYPADEGETLGPVVIAMSNAFEAFPVGVATAPLPRRKVEYGTATFVDTAGNAVTTHDLVQECQMLALAGHGPAALIAQDQASGLALLRLYGAGTRASIVLSTGTPASDVSLVGITDPDRQSGGQAASISPARIGAKNASGQPTVDPAPGLGFAGAAVVDAAGALAGIVDVRTQAVAGPGAGRAQAALVPAATIDLFVRRHDVTPAGESRRGESVKGAVARVICVRK